MPAASGPSSTVSNRYMDWVLGEQKDLAYQILKHQCTGGAKHDYRRWTAATTTFIS